MFTGIITEIGGIVSVESTEGGRRLLVEAPRTSDGLRIGDSVAINGVCLTVVAIADDVFAVEAVTETINRTNLGGLDPGARVDLERPVASEGGRFDGHVVQGHVDGVGHVQSLTGEGEAVRARIVAPSALAPYLVEKGSVTVDGVSLTVTAVAGVGEDPAWFEVVLIPHTLEVTVLGDWTPETPVNIEADIFAKYVERLMESRT